jgi:alcohol dehydrogenase class IV
MNTFTCVFPSIRFGDGVLDEFGETARSLGRRAFLAIDPYLESTGTGDRIRELLSAAGLTVVTWSDIQPNPSCFGVDEATALAREAGSDLVVAVGGGSAIDFGKAVAVVAPGGGRAWRFTERADHEIVRPSTALPIVAIPTTAGTGTEATPFAVLNNPELRQKSTIVNDLVLPAKALIDPTLMLTMPPALTASTGFDALAHAIESRISRHSTPFSRMMAIEAIGLVARHLRRAVSHGDDPEARRGMAWAAALAGASIAHVGVALPHALAQPVGGYTGAAHGATIAAVMVPILEESWRRAPEPFAAIARAMDPTLAALPTAEQAERSVRLVADLLGDIGIAPRLADFGMTDSDIDAVTGIALTSYYFDIDCHPHPVSKEDITRIYRRCL